MALITSGSFNDLAAAVDMPALEGLETVGVLEQATREAQSAKAKLPTSDGPRGLGLKSLTLSKGFEGILGGVFNKKNEIYFLSWTWDLSGETPYLHPGKGVATEDCLIPIKTGEVREFGGTGALLFPQRIVKSGIATRIQLWESDSRARDLGKTIETVADTIEKSELNNLLKFIALAGPQVAQLTLIKDAALELAKLIGVILKANSDDYVDFFEGYYPVSTDWTGEEKLSGHASGIVLSRFA
jgi:hypothetical protein